MLADPAVRLPRAWTPSTVLVVDDDALVRRHLAGVLQGAGYAVCCAEGASEALRFIDEMPWCLVLADWEMPDMDGLALCREIRERQRASYVYVMLLTVRGSRQDVVEGFRAGADDYIVKGSSTAELLARLECGRRIITYHTTAATNSLLPTVHPPVAPPEAIFASGDLSGRLARDYERCRLQGAPIAAVTCDVDYLDCLRERFGETVARGVWIGIRAEVDKMLLDSEWSAAIDERTFMLVLPGTTLEGAQLVARKIGAAVAARGHAGTAGLPLTASLGVAAIERPFDYWGHAPAALIQKAMECLWQSRARGGNRLTVTSVQSATGAVAQ
jgi:PleD family two-component response regulator